MWKETIQHPGVFGIFLSEGQKGVERDSHKCLPWAGEKEEGCVWHPPVPMWDLVGYFGKIYGVGIQASPLLTFQTNAQIIPNFPLVAQSS